MKLRLSAPSEEKLIEEINKYFYSTSFRIENGKLFNSKGEVPGFTVKVQKGRYKLYQN